ILYTRYTKVAHDEHDQGIDASPNQAFVGQITQYGALRPVADEGLGFGWGGYFSNQDYHFDLLARYDFMVAWSQNVMYELVNNYGISPKSDVTPGDLYLHGATITARFDF